MWTRRDLKAKGKAAFKANFWRCVLVAFIVALIGGATGGAAGGAGGNVTINGAPKVVEDETTVTQEFLDGAITMNVNGDPTDVEQFMKEFNSLIDDIRAEEGGEEVVKAIGLMLAGILGVVFAISFVINILIINPLRVGCNRFFAENSYAPAELGELGYGFKNGYGRAVGTMLRTDIYLILWSLLFIIPGIIKSYSYRMVPYILAEEPELSGKEAITRSRQMMNGNKWKTFVLDLSWILWIFFGIITLGIGMVFYVEPYMEATNAELYHALKGSEA